MKKYQLACLALCVCALGARATIIDNYSDYDPTGAGIYDTGNGWTISAPVTGTTIVETGIAGALGGNRTSTYYTAATFGSSSLQLIHYPGYELAAINNGASDYSTAVFSYSGFSIDLTTGTKLVLDFDPDHLTYQKDAVISMTIGDGTDSSTVTYDTWDPSFQPGEPNYSPDRFDLEFLVADYAGVDITSITSISLSIETDLGGDYGLYGISTDAIPEPAAIGLIGLFTGGLYFVRRFFMV